MNERKKKVSVIGAGNVGATTAQLLAAGGFCDVVLFDIVDGMPQGKALDIAEACPLWNSSAAVTGTNDYAMIEGSDIVTVTAGMARKPGMSRDDLLKINADIISGVAGEILKHAPDSIVIVVTNPMDVMAHLVLKTTGFNSSRVMGMGGVLDAARFCSFVAAELKVSPEVITSMLLGGHGDQMVPLPRFTTVRGIPVTELLPAEKIEAIVERTRNGGAEIVALLKTGSAYYAPAASIYEMIKSIVLDEKKVLPVSCCLEGQYAVDHVYAGVPAVLGKSGVEAIIELNLNDVEKSAFMKSVNAVRNLVNSLS
ncbi:MAG: malate dehydrogenase [Nitrospirae bacterium YQR-1]